MDKNLETNLRGLQKKREEHSDISERMRQLEGSRDTISQETYNNLRNDYEGKLSELQTFISQTETQANTRATDIDLQTRSLEEKKNALEKEISEATLLLANGALSQADFNAKTGEKKRQLRDVERSIGSLAGEKGQIEAYLSGTAVPKGTSAGISAGWLSSLAEKLHISYIKENLGTVLPIAGGVVGFIVLAIVATTFLGKTGSGNIEDFILEYANSGSPEERRDCTIRHFGSPDIDENGRGFAYTDKGILINFFDRRFLALVGTDAKHDIIRGLKEFSGTMLLGIRISDPVDKIIEIVKKSDADGVISNVEINDHRCDFEYDKNNHKFDIRMEHRFGRIRNVEFVLRR